MIMGWQLESGKEEVPYWKRRQKDPLSPDTSSEGLGTLVVQRLLWVYYLTGTTESPRSHFSFPPRTEEPGSHRSFPPKGEQTERKLGDRLTSQNTYRTMNCHTSPDTHAKDDDETPDEMELKGNHLSSWWRSTNPPAQWTAGPAWCTLCGTSLQQGANSGLRGLQSDATH